MFQKRNTMENSIAVEQRGGTASTLRGHYAFIILGSSEDNYSNDTRMDQKQIWY
jgi:hypothetical protein